MRKRTTAIVAAAAAAVLGAGAKVGLAKRRQSDPSAEGFTETLRRRGRHTFGQAKGLAYHALRRHPATDVDDATLADRIRSSIGSLEKRLHTPRVHVTVEHGVAILHGEAPTSEAAKQIETAVAAVAGVRDVRSHLTTTGQPDQPDDSRVAGGGGAASGHPQPHPRT